MIYVLADAVADANAAIKLNPSYALAYLRKGVACHHLEEYETALAAFKAGAKLEPSNAKFRNGIRKAEAELQSQGGLVCEGSEGACNEDDCKAEDYGAKLEPSNAKFRNGIRNGIRKAELQSQEEDMTVDAPAPSAPSTSEAPASAPTASAAPTSSAPVTTPAPAPAPAPPKYRHEFYQSATTVVVTVFAKGVSSEQLKVQIGEQVLSVVIESTNDEPPYVLQLRLFGKVQMHSSPLPVTVSPLRDYQPSSFHLSLPPLPGVPCGGGPGKEQARADEHQGGGAAGQGGEHYILPLPPLLPSHHFRIFPTASLPIPPPGGPAKSKHVRMSTKVEVRLAKAESTTFSPFLRCPLTIFASSLLPPFPSPPPGGPAKSKHVLMSTKIEVRLAKAEAIHWTALEATRRPAVVQPVNVSDETAEKLKHMYPSSHRVTCLLVSPFFPVPPALRLPISPFFPTRTAEKLKHMYPSSRKQHVNWDQLEAEVKAE
ncbi:unnamed protein product, partial [Closterium sp. NIES-64]